MGNANSHNAEVVQEFKDGRNVTEKNITCPINRESVSISNGGRSKFKA